MLVRSALLGRAKGNVPNIGLIERYASTVLQLDVKSPEETKWNEAKSFDEIPGPRALPIIGNMFRFLPYIGEFGDLPLMEQMYNLKKQYGPIVKLDGIPHRRTVVFLFEPELSEKMYRTEGRWPTRISMETMVQYRQERHELYKGNYGLATSQGEDWHNFRSKVNQHMMQPRTIKPHVGQINEVAQDFIEKMRKLRDPETLELPESFNNEMNKWALESICAIALDHRLGCLEPDLPADSEPQKMINAVHDMFELFYKLEILPSLWKVYRTRNLKKLFHTFDIINGISKRYISEAREKLRESKSTDTENLSMLQRLVTIDEQTANVMIMDMMLAGIDTTSNVAGSALYHIATNPQAQEKLHQEAAKVLPEKDSPITYETLNKIPYVKACIKETLRMSPIAIGNLRTMQKDIVLEGYKIPSGIDVIACHGVLAQDPEQFPRPDEFIPERWLQGSQDVVSAKTAHPFAYMPFGFGPRTCIGRRFAQLEMETLLTKVIRNFHLEWHHEPMKFKSRFVQTLGSPLQMKILDF